MRPWQKTIAALTQHASALPEPFWDIYELDPPSDAPWPRALPACPPLQELYKLTDGGSLGAFSFLPLGEIEETTTSAREWIDSLGLDDLLPPGRWFEFGTNEHGLNLIWNADRDTVLLYSTDAAAVWSPDDKEQAYDGSEPSAPRQTTMAQFLASLVNPVNDSGDESQQLWYDALEALDRVAATRPG